MDEPQALELFTQAARLGYGPSQHKLGMAYEFGNITCPVDPRRSIAYYTRAAERGEPDSELALSGWYLTGMRALHFNAFLCSRVGGYRQRWCPAAERRGSVLMGSSGGEQRSCQGRVCRRVSHISSYLVQSPADFDIQLLL